MVTKIQHAQECQYSKRGSTKKPATLHVGLNAHILLDRNAHIYPEQFSPEFSRWRHHEESSSLVFQLVICCIGGWRLIAGANGGLYGTTQSGGMNLRGNIFEITPSGRLKTIYSFCSQTNCADGDTPFAGVIQTSDGTLYGATYLGGDLSCEPPTGCGVLFSLTQ